jgi:hypothetical protein
VVASLAELALFALLFTDGGALFANVVSVTLLVVETVSQHRR